MANFINSNLVNFIISLAVLLTIIIFLKYLKKTIDHFRKEKDIKLRRTIYIIKISRLLSFILFLVFMSVIWGINYSGIFIFATTFFTIVGVALFASWSILSNITSSIILFTSCPFKIDDNVQILDGDNTIEGKIIDMTLFNVILEDSEDNVISYPNNILMQKTVVKKSI